MLLWIEWKRSIASPPDSFHIIDSKQPTRRANMLMYLATRLSAPCAHYQNMESITHNNSLHSHFNWIEKCNWSTRARFGATCAVFRFIGPTDAIDDCVGRLADYTAAGITQTIHNLQQIQQAREVSTDCVNNKWRLSFTKLHIIYCTLSPVWSKNIIFSLTLFDCGTEKKTNMLSPRAAKKKTENENNNKICNINRSAAHRRKKMLIICLFWLFSAKSQYNVWLNVYKMNWKIICLGAMCFFVFGSAHFHPKWHLNAKRFVKNLDSEMMPLRKP